MAEPDRISVWIHAYRGDRNETLANRCGGLLPPEPTFEECLLYAGHAGVSFEGQPEVFGFLPHAPSLKPSDLMTQLKNLGSFPGKVDDHQEVFRYASSRGRTVLRLEYLYARKTAERIQAEILRQQISSGLTYAFPGVPGAYNCVAWLRQVGLIVPEESGQMVLFTTAIAALVPHAPVAVYEDIP